MISLNKKDTNVHLKYFYLKHYIFYNKSSIFFPKYTGLDIFCFDLHQSCDELYIVL